MISEQSGKLLHTSNVYHHQWAAKLAELIVSLTQKEGGLGYTPNPTPSESSAKVFFSNTGTEANEGALKIARKVGKDRWSAQTGIPWESDPTRCTKTRIACFENSFHGRTMGSISVTVNAKYQQPFVPLIPGIDVGELNDFNLIDKIVTRDTCAVIVEPIQGEGGIHIANLDWLRALKKRSDEVGAVLIFDEIQVRKVWRFVVLPCLKRTILVRTLSHRNAMGSFGLSCRLPSGHSHNGQALG